MARAFRVAAAAILWAALIVQFVLFVTDPNRKSLVSAVVGYLSYFTILSNLVGAAVMTAVAFPTPFSGRAASPGARTAALLYLGIVAVVYHLVLAPRWDPKGWQLATDIVLHTVAPLVLAAEWLLLTPKRELKYRGVMIWLGLPIAYGAYTLARGAITGIYPYFFLNVAELGFGPTLLNLAGLLAIFGLAGVALVALGRKLPNLNRMAIQP
jgi:hypothetical protein